MNSQLALLDFSFEELKNMVNTIAKTKKRSSDMMWTQGTNLHSIDDLEKNVDGILHELTRRVATQWSIERIQYNFAMSSTMLPNSLMNLFNITPSELNQKIRSQEIGAERKDGYDEIWIKVNNAKYIMTHSGVIETHPVD